jgi:signal transduction histidine kinase
MSTLKVLVIDDEPGIRSGIARILKNYRVDFPFMEEAFDFQVDEASTGEEGIVKIDSNRPDILLLDNKLPGIQGIDVLGYIHQKQYNIIVVMITSYASLELAVKATTDGAYDFIPKPFTPQELKSSLENITKKIFLKKMAAKLQDAGREIRFQFLSVLSHELKAPLNAVDGYLRMIRERQLGEKLEDYDEIIGRSFERIRGMRSLILDLLDLTKIESGKATREERKVDITGIARTAIETMQPYSIQREVEVNLEAPETLFICSDAGELEIIFNNLISNAIKYNKEGGKVVCRITESPESVSIAVSDTGIGMTKADIDRLFQAFVRIKNEKTKHISGSGLGLSIVKKLVDSSQGTIHVESIPDQGSTFNITIPKVSTCI